jgi:hypothetical protein
MKPTVQHGPPVLWATRAPDWAKEADPCAPGIIDPILGGQGTARRLKSWGHDSEGVHFLAHRSGIGQHTDLAYLRYSFQLVLRNDGTRIAGENDAYAWHPPMERGRFYCLDTHVPHSGVTDPRLTSATSRSGLVKVVIAFDRDHVLRPGEAWPLIERYMHHRLTDFPVGARPPRWRQKEATDAP